jgi:hypothetical protein
MNSEKFGTNTDGLIKAVEIADDCDMILVLYRKKPELGSATGFFHVGGTSNAELLWDVERFRLHLLGAIGEQ